MRQAIFLFLTSAGVAAADPGHLGEVAGHSHWIGLAAAGGAAVIAGWLSGLFSGEEAEEEIETEEQEA